MERRVKTVDPILWSEPDERSMVRLVAVKRLDRYVAEVLEAVEANHPGLMANLESIGPWKWGPGGLEGEVVPRKGSWRLVTFAVTGTNEGWYIHAGILEPTPDCPKDAPHWTYRDLVLAKTFEGREAAEALASALGEAMET